jgi:hypothetical protein
MPDEIKDIYDNGLPQDHANQSLALKISNMSYDNEYLDIS